MVSSKVSIKFKVNSFTLNNYSIRATICEYFFMLTFTMNVRSKQQQKSNPNSIPALKINWVRNGIFLWLKIKT